MLRTNSTKLDENLKARLGLLFLIVGSISFLQAANLFPLGNSEYPAAITAIAIGGALRLNAIPKKKPILRVAQTLFAILAIALILLF